MSFTGHFSPASWVIIIGYMIFTTWLGGKLAGKQATIRDFFLGGRKLPWYAICGSIIATELSAMTLVGVPAFLWAETGDMTYAILGVGTILARIIVGFVFVPRYYDEEIYSPYEYIGNRLGERARRVTSLLFMAGGMMGQGARVLMTAVVLNVVLSMSGTPSDASIHMSIWIVGAVAILWTYMGGIRTVIWTDVIQFVIFSLSAALTLVVVVGQFQTATGESGVGTILKLAYDAGKLHWLDLSLDPRKEFTLLTGLVASTLGGLAAYGTDQMMVQRMFCCKGPREARRAIIWSSVSQVLMLICLFVGVALWAFYKKSGLPGVPLPQELAQINKDENSLLPVFIKYRVNWVFGGIMVAGIFAAAISTLESILAALAQQTLEMLQRIGRITLTHGDDRSEAAAIGLSRLFVVFWGVVLCGMASMFQIVISGGGLLIVLALSVVGYTAGGILGTFLMALIPKLRRQAAGMEWSALLSILTIFALRWHEPWALWAIVAIGMIMMLTAAWLLPRKASAPLTVCAFMLFIIFLNQFKAVLPGSPEPVNLTLSFPWFAPMGALVMIVASQFICAPVPKES
ncbi:hypothetical protein LLG95_06955 [bacterium]|nr:hypothetical protein [bacterium]